MLLKLQEVDETLDLQAKKKPVKVVNLPDLISGNISSEQLLKMLEEKVKLGMIAAGQRASGFDSGLSEDEMDDTQKLTVTSAEGLVVDTKTPSVKSFVMDDKEKPTAYPSGKYLKIILW